MPSGAKVVLETPFNTSDGEGQLWEIYPGAGLSQTMADAPRSAPAVSTSILRAGQSTGGQQTVWPKPKSERPLSNLYMCLTFKMGPDYVGLRIANKLAFIGSQDFPFGRTALNGFFGLDPNGSYPAKDFSLYFGHNTGNGILNNDHTCSTDHGLKCEPNMSRTKMVPNTWYTIEAYVVSSKTTTSRDGTVEWWVNGELNGRYTDMNYGDGIVNEWQLNHTWDNGQGVQCGPPTNPANDKGRDCTKDQTYSFDHVVLASVGAE